MCGAVDVDAVERGGISAYPCCVSRIAVHLLRNREHHHFRGVIGGIFSNVCEIGRVGTGRVGIGRVGTGGRRREGDRHVSHDFFAHGHGATDAEGVADDEGVAAHGGRGGFGAATRSHNQTTKGVGGEEEQEVEEEEAEIFHIPDFIVSSSPRCRRGCRSRVRG